MEDLFDAMQEEILWPSLSDNEDRDEDEYDPYEEEDEAYWEDDAELPW